MHQPAAIEWACLCFNFPGMETVVNLRTLLNKDVKDV